ncbi:sugar O-acetyltransferase [Rhodobacteraceae bacterium N5(2021)]|uniref:Sugar O-acetyltransferase n=1 Tax=Gymnodinialimonas phycosphaerae TaxID=2841589 RepID=A0A975TVP0_9RHOB|nr:sugar O-acetyltransferase [Gymnodinialimonas phycosphaerae]MBY4891562.1 sugar O-acetyltransferase [Gymnodinialimonas phycosphaerae]
MALSEREKRDQGAWYTCLDPELGAMRDTARAACFQHNTTPPDARGALSPLLAALLAEVGAGALMEAPFHCAYGHNIALGRNVYLNAGCVILDTGPVSIGDGAMLGPAVQIYCADHHRDVTKRAAGMERALPVTLGRDVWVGGGAIILPGVTVGDGAIIGAGAVVTQDVAAGTTVVGNPARAIST